MAIDALLNGSKRAKIAWALTAAIVIAGLILVFAMPGPPPRKYPDRIPVRFWHMWTAEWKVVVENICDRFNESQDKYEVLPLSIPGTSGDAKFLLGIAGGNPPDVMAHWNPSIPKWSQEGLLVPLNTLMPPAQWEELQRIMYPAARKIGMCNGNLYGVTTGLNTWACYCRVDYLREAGLDPKQFPDTLEGLMAWGDKLNRFDKQGGLTRVGFLPRQFMMYAPGFGGGIYDWNAGKLTLNTPENLRAMSFLVEPRQKLGFDNIVKFMSGLATGVGDMSWPFITGAYAIEMDGQWRVQQLAKYAPNLEYVTVPIPAPAGGKKLFGWVNGNFMIIPTGAKQVQGAWEFIKFWSGVEQPERAAEFYTWGGWLPLTSAVANAPIYRQYVKEHPQFQTFLDILPSDNLQPVPPVAYQMYLWDRVNQADDSAMRGAVTPQQALTRVEQEIARELAIRKESGYVD
ncbi:MAG: ABC transporter substrate-binding protein [Candidatus Hydrogenedentes bacterium]|nr:ABC transporter substrate-binding protein [Candidatus Hydrogenedentota bacterium]